MLEQISRSHFKFSWLLLLASLTGGCEIHIGGPETAAVQYVRKLVEQPEPSDELRAAYLQLPNKVILEYARALHAQGVDQKYQARKLLTGDDQITKVTVTIVPKRARQLQEREHTLVVDLKKEERKGWVVVGLSALP